jgi:hypothetical protein
MSLFSYPIGREVPVKAILPGSLVTLYTAGNNGASIVALRVAEVGNGTPTITLDVYDGSTAYEVAHLRAFSAKEIWNAVTLDGVPIVLLPGDLLRATASAGDVLHVTGVAIEPPQRT